MYVMVTIFVFESEENHIADNYLQNIGVSRWTQVGTQLCVSMKICIQISTEIGVEFSVKTQIS